MNVGVITTVEVIRTLDFNLGTFGLSYTLSLTMCFKGIYKSPCPCLVSVNLYGWVDTDETLQSCSIQAEDVHKG